MLTDRITPPAGAWIAIVIAFIIALLFPADSSACDCASLPSCHTYWTADAVFIGKVERVTTGVDHKSAAHLVVGEWLRGEKVGQKVVIDVTGAAFACNAYGFAEGVTYMVHASRGEHGEWRVWKCGGTAPLAFAAAALKYARESSRGNAPGRLYGFGFIDERPDPNDQGGPPLVGAALRLSSDRRTFATTTDAKGDYRFDGIPPGEYTLHITHAGIQALPPKRFVVGTEACIFYPFWSRPRHVQEESLCPQ